MATVLAKNMNLTCNAPALTEMKARITESVPRNAAEMIFSWRREKVLMYSKQRQGNLQSEWVAMHV